MRVLLLQLDGKTPNLAIMRLAGHHRARGDEVELRHCASAASVERGFWDGHHYVYASAIFERTRPVVLRLLAVRPDAIVGGTGWDEKVRLPEEIEAVRPDYSDYAYPHSIGFTQRGCRLRCPFCLVPRKEGPAVEAASVWDIWRGDPHPRNLLLLDNDFFGVPSWRKRIEEIRAGKFKVCWNQGFNVRLIGEEEAAAIASTDYRDDQFKVRRLYTAWDSRKDESRLFRNLEALVRHGVKPDSILVYMLVGFWDGPHLTSDDFYRHQRLREFGCRPYPMPYVRTDALRGFQRWIIGAYDKRIPWPEWEAAGYEPRRLGLRGETTLF